MNRIMSYIWYSIVGFLFRLMPIKNNRIVFENFFGKGYGDNPKYLANEFLQRGGYEVIWLVKEKDVGTFPNDVRIVKRGTLSELYYLSTAKVWVDNSRKPYGLKKRKQQFYLQTWHGGFPMKQIERAVEEKLDRGYILSAKNDSKMIDVLLSNNGFMTKIYKRDFWYGGEILECGCPRNDIVFARDKKIQEKVHDYYGIEKKTKICLYAPTFRKDGSLLAYNINFKNLVKELEQKFGGKWKVLVRLHPNIASKSSELLDNNDAVIDASKYDDVQELLVATDFMITDYSSCIFDYAISSHMCCIYANDIEEYTKDRGFYMELSDYPFEITTTNDELSQCIRDYDEERAKRRIDNFFIQVDSFEDGKGVKTVVDYTIREMEQK